MRISNRHVHLLIAAVLLLTAPLGAQVQVIRQVIANGATASVSPNAVIVGTIGQTIIGTATSSSHAGFLGFWYTYPMPQAGAVREDYNGAVTGASATVKVAPNPVVNHATITITLPASGYTTLKLFSAVGDESLTLIDGHRLSGTTTIQLPATDLESGSYMLVLQSAGSRVSVPMRVIH